MSAEPGPCTACEGREGAPQAWVPGLHAQPPAVPAEWVEEFSVFPANLAVDSARTATALVLFTPCTPNT